MQKKKKKDSNSSRYLHETKLEMKATQDILAHYEKRIGLGRCPKSQLPLMGKLQESGGFNTRRWLGYSFEVLLNFKSLCFLYYAYFIFQSWSLSF